MRPSLSMVMGSSLFIAMKSRLKALRASSASKSRCMSSKAFILPTSQAGFMAASATTCNMDLGWNGTMAAPVSLVLVILSSFSTDSGLGTLAEYCTLDLHGRVSRITHRPRVAIECRQHCRLREVGPQRFQIEVLIIGDLGERFGPHRPQSAILGAGPHHIRRGDQRRDAGFLGFGSGDLGRHDSLRLGLRRLLSGLSLGLLVDSHPSAFGLQAGFLGRPFGTPTDLIGFSSDAVGFLAFAATALHLLGELPGVISRQHPVEPVSLSIPT